MSQQNEHNILNLLQEGNLNALDYLIKTYFAPLCLYGEKIINNRAEVEDITEELFIKLWERKYVFENIHQLKGFLFTSIRNACLNSIRNTNRKNERHKEFVENDTISDNEFVEEEMLAEIQKTINSLPEKMRKIFILSYYKKMSNDEIAAYLNLTNQTVRNQKTNAINTLRKLLKEKSFLTLLINLYM